MPKRVGWFPDKGVDDERDRHPFYSNQAKKLWRKRLKELEQSDKKPRRKSIDPIRETTPQED